MSSFRGQSQQFSYSLQKCITQTAAKRIYLWRLWILDVMNIERICKLIVCVSFVAFSILFFFFFDLRVWWREWKKEYFWAFRIDILVSSFFSSFSFENFSMNKTFSDAIHFDWLLSNFGYFFFQSQFVFNFLFQLRYERFLHSNEIDRFSIHMNRIECVKWIVIAIVFNFKYLFELYSLYDCVDLLWMVLLT